MPAEKHARRESSSNAESIPKQSKKQQKQGESSKNAEHDHEDKAADEHA